MTFIHFIVFACIVYIAIVSGRMSAKNDMRRRFASIGAGQKFPDVTSVINYVLKLREQVSKLEHDNQALNNSLKMANYTSEKLTEDYKALMAQMKEKREECEMFDAANKKLVARINKCADKFDEWMQKLWEFASAINNNACEHRDNIGEYIFLMKKTRHKLIYATELLNKSHLLSIGKVEVQKNGSLKYSEGSRSLGNYDNKENWAWTNDLNPLRVLPQMNPRESRPIALITDYKDYQNLLKKFGEVSKSSVNDITESANMLDYMKEIKNEFPNILYNNK